MMSVSHAAVSGEMARTPSCFDESNSTFPSYVVIFDTKRGSWRMPPLAIVDATVAISSGVALDRAERQCEHGLQRVLSDAHRVGRLDHLREPDGELGPQRTHS